MPTAGKPRVAPDREAAGRASAASSCATCSTTGTPCWPWTRCARPACSPADDGQFVPIDLSDHGQVVEALTGAIEERPGPFDGVVHLGAIPAPGLAPNAVTFRNNSAATWNVFDAARVAGIRNVVWASSETVLGLPFDAAPRPTRRWTRSTGSARSRPTRW